MRRAQVILPEDDELGPAMRELSEQRQKFVIAFVEGGGRNATRAVEVSGYGGTPGSVKVQAHRLMHDPRILKAIREEADRRLDGGVYVAAAALVEIAADPDHRDRYKAAADIMDRRGFMRVTGQHIEIEDKRTEAELIQFIAATARKHGLDPRLLLGSDAIDAKFKDVTDVAQTTPTARPKNGRARDDAETGSPDAVEAEGSTPGSD